MHKIIRNRRLSVAIIVGLSLAWTVSGSVLAENRELMRIDDNWRFHLGDAEEGGSTSLDDSDWRVVNLPHDWSIEGKMDPKAPMGGAGGFLPAGLGWYRLHLKAPGEWQGRRVRAEFEGVYMNASIYLNGQKLDFHPYGFTSFFVDLTPALKIGGDNLLAVRVDNSEQKNCRWYSGSGIYRHVWLEVTNPIQVAPSGVFVSTKKATAQAANISVQSTLLNQTNVSKTAKIVTIIQRSAGQEIGRSEASVELPAFSSKDFHQELAITDPPLWFPEAPQLSRVVTDVVIDGNVSDEVTTTFGVRALAWSAGEGLTLNGKTYKLSGGCIHDDNGVLGACAFDRAEERKIEMLKAAGFNAIRTAHNPPSPALLDACDRLGMLVMEEAFDCWERGKNAKDYSLIFKDWWQRDLDSMVERDRNHPSIVLWSIGNEIPGVWDDMGGEYAPKLAKEIHSLDPTRPVTNGLAGWPVDLQIPSPKDANHLKNAEINWNSEDIAGTNYALAKHVAQHDKFPNRIIVSTESHGPLGEPYLVADNSYVVGDFEWSAQDYLGEVGDGRWFYEGDPTEPLAPPKKPGGKAGPLHSGFDPLYPWRGANPGDVDIIGDTKAAGHLRNIVWDMGEKLYLSVRQPEDDKKIILANAGWFPTWESWTWPGREGKPMAVDVYSRYPSVRLYLNDTLEGEMPTTRKENFQATFKLPYQPGILKAVGVEDGKESESMQLETVSDPASIKLSADRSTIHADGQDLSFIQVDVLDKQGRLQPNADGLISFTLTGPGTIAGLGNAWLKSTEPFQGTTCHVYHGRALVVLRGSKTAGTLDLTADSPGLASSNLAISCR